MRRKEASKLSAFHVGNRDDQPAAQARPKGDQGGLNYGALSRLGMLAESKR
jgi:hypothetical protein